MIMEAIRHSERECEMWTQPIVHSNGGEPMKIICAACGTELGNQRAASRCLDGKVRFFCVPERDDPSEYSCYVQWTRSRH